MGAAFGLADDGVHHFEVSELNREVSGTGLSVRTVRVCVPRCCRRIPPTIALAVKTPVFNFTRVPKRSSILLPGMQPGQLPLCQSVHLMVTCVRQKCMEFQTIRNPAYGPAQNGFFSLSAHVKNSGLSRRHFLTQKEQKVKIQILVLGVLLTAGASAFSQTQGCGYVWPGNPVGCENGPCRVDLDQGIVEACVWPDPCPAFERYQINECCRLPVNSSWKVPIEDYCLYGRLQDEQVLERLLAVAQSNDILVPTCRGTLLPVEYVLGARAAQISSAAARLLHPVL